MREDRAQRVGVTGLGGRLNRRLDESVEEAVDLAGRDRAVELRDDDAVLEGLDGRDALDLERLCKSGIRLGINLGELDRTAATRDGGFERGGELLTRPAPFGPEVDHDGDLVGGLDDLEVELCCVDVDTHGRIVGESSAS